MKNVCSLVLSAGLLTLTACGEHKTSSNLPVRDSLQTTAGHYEATLTSMNSHLGGDVTGKAVVRVTGDDFLVEVHVGGAAAQVTHMQNIHISDECPTLASDTNKDGIIDSIEGMKFYGPAIIPLDADLKTQIEANETFPSADFAGDYFYRQNVSMLEMMKDLMDKNPAPQAGLTKLKSGLDLSGRQVVIYGVGADTQLPESVATMNGQLKHVSLPIACGTLIKVADSEEGPHTSGGKD